MSKKVLVIGAISIIALIVLFLGIFAGFQNSSNEIKVSKELSGTSKNGKVTLEKYSGESFSLYYPKNWKFKTGTLDHEGTFAASSINSETEYYPRISIDAYPAGTIDVSKISTNQPYLKDIKVTQTTFQGLPATKISSVTNVVFAKGNPSQVPVTQIHYIIKKGDKDYVVSYSYHNDQYSEEYIKLFEDMIQKVELK